MDIERTILCIAGAVGEARSAWSYLLVEPDGLIEEDASACAGGSVDRMVLRAAVEGLRRHGAGQVVVRTQSRALIRTAADWIPGWRAQAWTRCDGVADLRLIQELGSLMERIAVQWVHVSYVQNPADQRARQRAQAATREPAEPLDPWAEDDAFDADFISAQHPQDAPSAASEVDGVPSAAGADARSIQPPVLTEPSELVEAPSPPSPAAEAGPTPVHAPPLHPPAPAHVSAPLPPPDPARLPGQASGITALLAEPLPVSRHRAGGVLGLQDAPLVPPASLVEPAIPPDELPDINAKNAIAEAMALYLGPRLVIYVSGQLSTAEQSRGPGGWSFLLLDCKTNRALSRRGGTAWTTVHRMELTAAVEALRSIRGSQQEIEIRTEFRWLIQAGEQWISNWRRQNWTRRNGQPVHNVDLLREIDDSCRRHRVSWRWISELSREAGTRFVADCSQRALEEMRLGSPPEKTTRYAESPIGPVV